ncbi:hypothetical protein [Mucilaginibacter sp.]|uniref:hypothetical protein n=1 Tax=Mucilaginibacter sp. TaxID=1882438 RepID=UPI00326576A0
MIFNLYWLTIAIGKTILPKYYNRYIVSERPEYQQWDWQYFLLGNAVFASVFMPLTNYGNSDSSGGDSGSSCGSSCGGSSCGGCGGD